MNVTDRKRARQRMDLADKVIEREERNRGLPPVYLPTSFEDAFLKAKAVLDASHRVPRTVDLLHQLRLFRLLHNGDYPIDSSQEVLLAASDMARDLDLNEYTWNGDLQTLWPDVYRCVVRFEYLVEPASASATLFQILRKAH